MTFTTAGLLHSRTQNYARIDPLRGGILEAAGHLSRSERVGLVSSASIDRILASVIICTFAGLNASGCGVSMVSVEGHAR